MASFALSFAASSIFTHSSSSLFLTTLKLKPTSPFHLSFPLRLRHHYLMSHSHSLARATLGLTHPSITHTPNISFAAKDADVAEWKGDMLAVGVTEKDLTRNDKSKFENPILSKLDSKLGGLLAEASLEEDFNGKVGQSTLLRIASGLGFGSKRVGLIGLGQFSSSSAAAPFKGFGEAVAAAAKSAQASNVAVVLASADGLSVESKLSIASAIASGTF